MCRRVKCKQCGKPTYAGCGAHIEQVLGDVPPAQRCKCTKENAATSGLMGLARRFFSGAG